MKMLQSTVRKKETRPISPPKRSYGRFIALLIIGILIGYIGLCIGGLKGSIIVLLAVACVIASFMQLIGTSECTCPNCEFKGYIYKYAKNYKCDVCKLTSVVIEKEEET